MKFSINGTVPKKILFGTNEVQEVRCTGGGGKWPHTSDSPTIWRLMQSVELVKGECIDWEKMFALGGGKSKVMDIYNSNTMITGYNGDASFGTTIWFKKPWKEYKDITIEFTEDSCQNLYKTSWHINELEQKFAAGQEFNILGASKTSNHNFRWKIWPNKSTDPKCWGGKGLSQNCGLVSIKEGYYGTSALL